MRKLPSGLRRVALTLFETLSTPRALTCAILLKSGEWDQLVTMTVDPSSYLDVPAGTEKYRRDSQATDFLRKCDAVPASFDRKKEAYLAFQKAEEQCFGTNYLIECIELGIEESPISQAARRIIRRARKIVREIMGPLPPGLSGRFGPGTSFELKGSKFATLADKLHVTPGVTQAGFPVWRHTYDGTIMDRRRLELGLPDHQIVRGNRFTTVAKDAKIDRGICIEPLGNLYCQLGVGSFLKDRLAAKGLYIQRNNTPLNPLQALIHPRRPNGQVIHQKLAAMASLTGDFATIDLSSASDTVAFNLVRALLPEPWFKLLAALRSPYTLIKPPKGQARWVKLEKFSSMGNGFTFELETIIFAALAATCGLEVGVDLFVYGDDIIVPTRASADVLAVLQLFGFTPNKRKTFVTGPFRESCGGDYFNGVDVRPYNCTNDPVDPLEWIAMHNQLTRRFPSFHLSKVVIDQIPTRFRLFGPSRLGHIVIHGYAKSRWRSFSKNGSRWVRGIMGVPVKIALDRWGDEFTVSLALLGVHSSGITPRGVVSHWSEVELSIS